jgi:acylphosphatase
MTHIKTRAKVRGRVQGVFFRQSTKDQAIGLGLSGWVRNVDDGSVELEAVGEAQSIGTLLEWLKVGPPMASVESVQILAHEEIEPAANLKHKFVIR